MKRCLIAAILIAGVTTIHAQPTTSPGSAPDEFDRLDADNDGSLTQSEATAASSSFMFTDADTDRDGRISRREYLQGLKNKPYTGDETEYEADSPVINDR